MRPPAVQSRVAGRAISHRAGHGALATARRPAGDRHRLERFEAGQVVVSAARSRAGRWTHAHLAGYGGFRETAGIARRGETLFAAAQGTDSRRCASDPGFRTPWFRAVSAMGWDWVGRLRGRTQVKPQDVPDDAVQWIDSRRLHALASNSIAVWCSMPRHRGDVSNAIDAHLSRASSSLKAAAREREPWLIVASPQLHAPSATQLVNLYARRMQIELAFRDLKTATVRRWKTA
ncbi:transposase [Xanthomonas oryzae]|uniref:transposase n=1 Tax=Xanthomonas oryzae TaxID=347 RepID=UPI00338DE417